jgi:hypothetical protein
MVYAAPSMLAGHDVSCPYEDKSRKMAEAGLAKNRAPWHN